LKDIQNELDELDSFVEYRSFINPTADVKSEITDILKSEFLDYIFHSPGLSSKAPFVSECL
jgi:hypothetical protein